MLPNFNSKISDLTIYDLSNIAKAGKVDKYNINIGDQINLIEGVDVEIINKTSDSIEFMTVQKVVNDNTPLKIIKLDDEPCYFCKSSFFINPQLNSQQNSTLLSYDSCELDNILDFSSIEEIINLNSKSNICLRLEEWYNSLPIDIKLLLSNVERTYYTMQLNFNNTNYSQLAVKTEIRTQKIYLPTLDELTKICTYSSTWDDSHFWTSTPVSFSEDSDPFCSLGRFYSFDCGNLIDTFCNECCGAVACFKIGK